jgi:hypothetical protein
LDYLLGKFAPLPQQFPTAPLHLSEDGQLHQRNEELSAAYPLLIYAAHHLFSHIELSGSIPIHLEEEFFTAESFERWGNALDASGGIDNAGPVFKAGQYFSKLARRTTVRSQDDPIPSGREVEFKSDVSDLSEFCYLLGQDLTQRSQKRLQAISNACKQKHDEARAVIDKMT